MNGKTYTATIGIVQGQLDYYQNEILKYGEAEMIKAGIPRLDNLRTWTAKFENGCEVDIKINTSEDDVWTEGVLFDKDGIELAHTEVCDNLSGEWVLEYESDKYIVNVIGTKPETAN